MDPRRAEAAEIHDRQVKRFELLRYLYKQSLQLQDGQIQSVPAGEIQGALGITPAERSQIEQCLMDRGLVEIVVFGPELAIATRGIDYVEAALTEPDRRTEFFPPASTLIMNISGGVHGSQIQQGTTGSTQTAMSPTDASASLAALVAELRAEVQRLVLAAPQQQELETDLSTIEIQTRAGKPKWSIVRESLASARNILEGVVAGAIYTKIVELLAALPY